MSGQHDNNSIAILGAGNIGTAIAEGLVNSGTFQPEGITLTRRKVEHLKEFEDRGFNVTDDNYKAVERSSIILVAVEPHQVDGLLKQIQGALKADTHTLISVASGVKLHSLRRLVSEELPVIRAMPNTAIAIRESMTCLATDGDHEEALESAIEIFDSVGETMILDEEQMIPATALGACGIAFFLRSIRAASQGGIETGLSAEDALNMAAQTARGAASLLLHLKNHPEYEIDKVTTPRGCTIAGLNEMEHKGFSSSIIQGIKTSAEKASHLYND